MNILNKTISALFLSVLIVATGCDSLLDTEPAQSLDQEIALETSSNVENTLTGAYDQISDTDLYGGELMFGPDLLGMDDEVLWSGTFSQPNEYFRKDILITNSFVRDTWLEAFEAINIANNVLSALDVVDEDIRSRVEGEAKFIRGAMYFELTRLFGRAWNDGDPSSNLGVPIITEPTREIGEEQAVPRGSVEDGYTQAIDDLTDAKDLLPESNGVYANTYVASAFLSRVYLQQGEYEDAFAEADRVIESGEYALTDTYEEAFNNAENSSEDIFAIQITSQDGANDLNLFYAADEEGGRGDVDIQQEHLDEYEEDDERLDLFYEDEEGDIRTGKFNNNIDGNISVVRLVEMYLTRAEAAFRDGDEDTARDDLNFVRERVGLPEYGGGILAEDIELEDILRERKLELMFEGQLLHDIKRTEGSVGSIPWDSPRLVFPIPQREMDANGELEQNDGYGS